MNPFRYHSYYYDTETKLYFLQSRYYDPEVGRFITIDDISYLDPDSINGLNLYAYCKNNPIMYVDYYGNIPKWLAWTLSGLAIVGGAIMVATGVLSSVGGVLIAAGVGSLVGGYVNEANGGSFTAGWYAGLATGALCALGGIAGGALFYAAAHAGSIPAILGLFASGITASFGLGAIGSIAGTFIISSVDKTEIDWNDAIYDAIVAGMVSIFSAFGGGYTNYKSVKQIWKAIVSYFSEGTSDLVSYFLGESKRRAGNPVRLFS